MARHPFPLVDLLIGVPSAGMTPGGPALLTHGTVVELFSDVGCTAPLDAQAMDGATAISSVTVEGVTIPEFLGPDNDVTVKVYGRPQGATGNGFPLYRSDALGTGGGGGGATDPEVVRDTIAAALVAGSNVTISVDDVGNTITIAATNTTDPEVVRDTMGTALTAGAGISITVDDVGNTITITATGSGSTDAEVVRDTIGAALVAGSGMAITVDDVANTITLAVTGRLLTTGNGDIALDGDTGTVGRWVITNDGTSTGTWPDRLAFVFDPGVGGWGGVHQTAWFNEYGEFRCTPGKANTIPLRVFGAETPGGWTTRDKSVSLFEVVTDRTDRVNVFRVDGNGDVVAAGTVTADNVSDRVECVPTGTTGFASMPDGTLWIEYTP